MMLLLAVPLRAGAVPAPLQTYEDPDKRFAIGYPKGWHVKRLPSGATNFYLDDAEEGTSFNVTPATTLKGEMDGQQVLRTFAQEIRKKYPDFKVVGQRKKPLPGNPHGTIVDVAATWTNVHRMRMKGWASLGAIKKVGQGTTVISYLGFQAPAKDFDKAEPVFNRMLRSLEYKKGP